MCKLLATVGGILDSSTKQVKNFNNSGKPANTKVGGRLPACPVAPSRLCRAGRAQL